MGLKDKKTYNITKLTELQKSDLRISIYSDYTEVIDLNIITLYPKHKEIHRCENLNYQEILDLTKLLSQRLQPYLDKRIIN